MATTIVLKTERESLPSRRDFTVFISARANQTLQNFHCVNCGKIVFQHYSDVKLVVDGQVAQQDQGKQKGTVIMCKKCKARLTIL